MNRTMNKDMYGTEKLAVDIEGLASMLSCGQATARKIGEEACAKIIVGRRVLYSVSKVKSYLEYIAE